MKKYKTWFNLAVQQKKKCKYFQDSKIYCHRTDLRLDSSQCFVVSWSFPTVFAN